MDRRCRSWARELLRWRWRGGTLAAAVVDLGPVRREVEVEDKGESDGGENEKMTAPPLFIDRVI